MREQGHSFVADVSVQRSVLFQHNEGMCFHRDEALV
jgi:hypothetical protein